MRDASAAGEPHHIYPFDKTVAQHGHEVLLSGLLFFLVFVVDFFVLYLEYGLDHGTTSIIITAVTVTVTHHDAWINETKTFCISRRGTAPTCICVYTCTWPPFFSARRVNN